MPKVRASSGMIGTIRLPTVLSRSRFRSRRVNAMVVDAAAAPLPLENSANTLGAGVASGFARTRRAVGGAGLASRGAAGEGFAHALLFWGGARQAQAAARACTGWARYPSPGGR